MTTRADSGGPYRAGKLGASGSWQSSQMTTGSKTLHNTAAGPAAPPPPEGSNLRANGAARHAISAPAGSRVALPMPGLTSRYERATVAGDCSARAHATCACACACAPIVADEVVADGRSVGDHVLAVHVLPGFATDTRAVRHACSASERNPDFTACSVSRQRQSVEQRGRIVTAALAQARRTWWDELLTLTAVGRLPPAPQCLIHKV